MAPENSRDMEELRILIVDDDASYRKLMLNMLQSIGVGNVPMAASALEARDYIQETNVDFVVADRTLEGAGGIALLKYLRDPKTTPAPHIPVIMSTDFGGAQHITAAVQAGADHVLAKPISPAELKMTIRNLKEKPPEKIECDTYVGPCRRRLPQKFYAPYKGEDRRKA